jgi:hypothetical protein
VENPAGKFSWKIQVENSGGKFRWKLRWKIKVEN